MKTSKEYNPILLYVFITALTAAGAVLYLFLYKIPLVGIDDANIYFTYMKNFANGYGFVFNPGGEHVEGFTSIFYTLIGSLVFLISDEIEVILFIMNIIFISYLLYKCSIFIFNLNGGKCNIFICSVLFIALLFIMPGYFFWTTISLMESGIWSMLLCLTILAIFDENTLSNRLKFMIFISLLILTRPEAYFWAFYLVLLRGLFYYLYHKQSLIRVFKENWIFLLTFVFVLASLLIWRYNYFGYLLPNTYYAKVYGSFWYNFKLGIEYLISFLIYTNPLILLTLASLFYLTKIKLKEITYSEAVQLILALVIIVALAIPVALGGDYFKWNRFYIVFLPIMYLPFLNLNFINKHILSVENLNGIIKQNKYMIYFILLILISLTPRESLDQYIRGDSLHGSFYVNQDGRDLVLFLNNFFMETDLPTISVIAAGIAYKYNGHTFDLMGLNNVRMAHSPHKIKGFKNHDAFNKDVFFEAMPDFIYEGVPAKILENPEDFSLDINNDEFKSRFINIALDEIWFDEKFQTLYKPVIITKKNTDKHIFTWAGTHYLAKLDSSIYRITYIPY